MSLEWLHITGMAEVWRGQVHKREDKGAQTLKTNHWLNFRHFTKHFKDKNN